MRRLVASAIVFFLVGAMTVSVHAQSYDAVVVADGPKLFWPLNDAAGSTSVADASGNSFNGTVHGGVVLGAIGGGVDGETAAAFDGSSGVISASVAPPTTMPVTFEFVIAPTSTLPVGVYDTDPGSPGTLRNFDDGFVEWQSNDPEVSMGVADLNFHLYDVIYRDNGSGLREVDVWLDGALEATGVGVGASSSFGWPGPINVGNINNGSAGWYGGTLQKFAIYYRQLTPAQIAVHASAFFGSGSPTPTPWVTPTPTATPSASPTDSPTPMVSPTAWPTASPTDTPTASPSMSPTPAFTPTCGATIPDGTIITISSTQYQVNSDSCPMATPTASPSPTATATATPVPSSTPTPIIVAGNWPPFPITNYGAVCDGSHDDSASINAAFAAAKAMGCRFNNNFAQQQAYVDFPPGKICKVNEGLTLDTSCVGINGNGATLDFSGMAATSEGVTTTADNQVSPYNDNLTVKDLKMIGNGRSNNSVALWSNSSGVRYENLSAWNWNHAVQIGNYSFLNEFANFHFISNNDGFYCPSGVNDAGENNKLIGGVIANGTMGINDPGACEFYSFATSFDYLSQQIVYDVGMVQLDAPHIEFNQLTGPMFQVAGPNAFEHLVVNGGYAVGNAANGTGSDMTAVIEMDAAGLSSGSWGPWSSITDMFMVNMNPSATCVVSAQNPGNIPEMCAIGVNSSQAKFLNVRNAQGAIRSTAQPAGN